MTNCNQPWRFAAGDEPPLGGALYWDRWARRLALAATGPASTPSSMAPIASQPPPKMLVRCFRTRITANLERLIEELHEEAERLNEQAAESLHFTESA